MKGYALDTSLVSRIRVSGLVASEWVGAGPILVSDLVVAEANAGLPEDDRKLIGNDRVFASLDGLLALDDQVFEAALALTATGARHQPALEVIDAQVAASAIVNDLVLITMNHRDMHHIDGLRWIDAVDHSTLLDGPLVRVRSVQSGGRSSRPCCRLLSG